MLRLSNHFLLLDFLYGQATMDSVVHSGESLSDRLDSVVQDTEEVVEGRYLCETVLEPIIEQHGPISIAAGLWFKALSKPRNAHGDPPHEWKRASGAAADFVVHCWVNQGMEPGHFLDTLPDLNIEHHRKLTYPGSEYFCLASCSAGNKYRPGVRKWNQAKARAQARSRSESSRNDPWRRQPYAHCHGTALRHDAGYESRLPSAESIWCGDPAEGQRRSSKETVVYGRKPPKEVSLLDHSIVEVPRDAFNEHRVGARKLCRPWHVRVSRNFVLLDLCRNERMFNRRMVTVPPLTIRTANTVVKVARMFGEVLDDVKEYLGNISVVRGMEPRSFCDDLPADVSRADKHRWIPGRWTNSLDRIRDSKEP